MKPLRLTLTLWLSLCTPAALCAPSISNLSVSAASVGKYEKFEATFDVATVASNPYWPYDPQPAANTAEHPNAVPAGVGVSVDGLFLPPGETDWNKAVVQPGFYYQEYESLSGFTKPDDDIVPKGLPCWKIRFAPSMLGQWRFRIRVIDAEGTSTYEDAKCAFTCVSSNNRGFVRVSPKDCRYFETSDGNYLNIVGTEVIEFPDALLNNTWHKVDKITDFRQAYPFMAENGLNLHRVWWNGSQRPAVFGISGQGGFVKWYNIGITDSNQNPEHTPRPGQLFSMIMGGADQKSSVHLCTRPNTNYRVTVWFKTIGLVGTGDYGVGIAVNDVLVSSSKVKGTSDWTRLEGFFRSGAGSYTWVDLKKYNCTGGTVLFTDVTVQEDLGGVYGPNVCWVPNLNQYAWVSQFEAYCADRQVEFAQSSGVYLKIALGEHIDECWCRIGPDGRAAPYSSNNFYGSPTHASRTYLKYFWRYAIARYGYATAIHSFEVTNEGDPFNGNHHEQTQAMAEFFKVNDPNRHLVTTSCWHSFPTAEFWGNPSFQSIGYADIHRHVGPSPENSNEWYMRYQIHGWQPSTVLSTQISYSPPMSLYIRGTQSGTNYVARSMPIAIAGGHTYSFNWRIRGQDVRTQSSVPLEWQYPTVGLSFKTGWWGSSVGTYHLPGSKGEFLGTFGWSQVSYVATAPSDARYIVLEPQLHWCLGEVWFDDITIRDETTGEAVYVPNGTFDEGKVDEDTALINLGLGTQVGAGSSRSVAKPVIDANPIIMNYSAGPGAEFNYGLNRDLSGIWYKKFVWGQMNSYGVISLYYNVEQNLDPPYAFLSYAKAYQSFMSNVPLSNGLYIDSKAVVSDLRLRAWGQKDLTNNRAHLWIDNKPYTWKSVVDGVSVSPVSGTVTMSGFKDGTYNVEWWDTSTGAITKQESIQCVGGAITLTVSNLVSDVACKVYPATAVSPNIELSVSVSEEQPKPGETVTVTVAYSNKGSSVATNVQVRAAVPANMIYVPGTGEASGGVYNAADGSVTWTIPSLPAGGNGTKSFKATVR